MKQIDPIIKNKRKAKLKKEFEWYTFLIPSLICLVLLTYIPTLTSLKYSFYRVSVLGFGEKFIGLKNYMVLLSSETFYRAFMNTVILVLLGLLVIPLGFILASLISGVGRGRLQTFFRVGFYIPNIITGVSVVLVFQYVLQTDGGLVNSFLTMLTGQTVEIGWLTNPDLTKIGVSIIGIWGGLGYNMLICLAGLQSIPREIYEAAEVDGATSFKKWLYITVPNMTETFVFLMITNVISGFARFTDLYIISGNSASGRPAGSIQSLLMYVYQYSFESPDYGLSSAGVMIIFVIIFAVTLLNLKWTKMLDKDPK